MGQHKRLSKRIPFRQRVKYGTAQSQYIVYTPNLSAMGTVVEATRILPPDTDIVLLITDSSDSSQKESFSFNARVVWAKRSIGSTLRGKMGLRFTSNKDAVETLYDKRLSVYSD